MQPEVEIEIPNNSQRIPRIRRNKNVEVEEHMRNAILHPLAITRELNNRSLYHFIKHFWSIVSPHDFSPNWHIEYLCTELEKIAKRVSQKLPREHDLIINVPPGSTKTITCSIMFPAWCWTQWPWMRIITASYSTPLALETAGYCRELLRSQMFKDLYPEIAIKDDQDKVSNFKIIKKILGDRNKRFIMGGGRLSTSVGATITGFHGDILIIDDPLNPEQAASDAELLTANRWMEQTLPTRKTNKDNSATILIMQRLHQNDPTGAWLQKKKANVFHICLPGEARNYKKQVIPAHLYQNYINDLLDPQRMSWRVLTDMEADLGQYGYAGQVGQLPTPPGGGMFKVDNFSQVTTMPSINNIDKRLRYWDKAATKDGTGAYTCGVKMCRLKSGFYIVEDVKRGRWATEERERIIRQTAEADGTETEIWIEQEPGSSGKDSAQGTIRNLAGFKAYKETASGEKADRADPFSVQVNNGTIFILTASWNYEFIEEYRAFPYSTYKDQVDAGSGCFNKLVAKKKARCISR